MFTFLHHRQGLSCTLFPPLSQRLPLIPSNAFPGLLRASSSKTSPWCPDFPVAIILLVCLTLLISWKSVSSSILIPSGLYLGNAHLQISCFWYTFLCLWDKLCSSVDRSHQRWDSAGESPVWQRTQWCWAAHGEECGSLLIPWSPKWFHFPSSIA